MDYFFIHVREHSCVTVFVVCLRSSAEDPMTSWTVAAGAFSEALEGLELDLSA